MTHRPVLFSGAMVRAILEGRKTQTRRPVKHPHLASADRFAFVPEKSAWEMGETHEGPVASVGWILCPFGVPGDRLWVRETFAAFKHPRVKSGAVVAYRATCAEDGGFDLVGDDGSIERCIVQRWTPSIHMPREASRLLLEVTEVRVERLQEIAEDDARAEGIDVTTLGSIYRFADGRASARDAFGDLWDECYGARGWAGNPWVWAITFRMVTP